jgi:hypothetical protein
VGIWYDQLSGYYVTNALRSGNSTWPQAVYLCQNLNNVTTAGTGWRLPTQKELLQLHIDGIAKVSSLGNLTSYFWTISSASGGNATAWAIVPASGQQGNAWKNSTSNSVLCLRE